MSTRPILTLAPELTGKQARILLNALLYRTKKLREVDAEEAAQDVLEVYQLLNTFNFLEGPDRRVCDQTGKVKPTLFEEVMEALTDGATFIGETLIEDTGLMDEPGVKNIHHRMMTAIAKVQGWEKLPERGDR